ncbi:MAG: DNA-binding protein [Bacteroidetes bacterium]|nr:DNA-binding protein [Bacteroidota bacterium]
MILTFEELRQLKDKLPSGSMQKIADELKIDVQHVRNYFGADHYSQKNIPGVHYEKGGPGGGIVKLYDTTIYDCAQKMLKNRN